MKLEKIVRYCAMCGDPTRKPIKREGEYFCDEDCFTSYLQVLDGERIRDVENLNGTRVRGFIPRER